SDRSRSERTTLCYGACIARAQGIPSFHLSRNEAMARDRKPPPTTNPGPDWDRTMRLFQAGSPEFVDAIRLRTNADALAAFAETWFTDSRVEAKRLLLAYLERPFNSPR